MWLKYGLKAQKLQKQHALKGHRPGYNSNQQGAL